MVTVWNFCEVVSSFKEALASARGKHLEDTELSPREMASELFEELVEYHVAMRDEDQLAAFVELLDIAVVAFRIMCGEFKHEQEDEDRPSEERNMQDVTAMYHNLNVMKLDWESYHDALSGMAVSLSVDMYMIDRGDDIGFAYVDEAGTLAAYALSCANWLQERALGGRK